MAIPAMRAGSSALATSAPLRPRHAAPDGPLALRRQRHVTGAVQRRVEARVAAADREVGPPALHLSFFLPFKSLPPDGQVIPPEEEACDVQVQKCKTQAYVWETPCPACDGTGHARTPHRSRRASLHTCIVCVGIGHVRRTTARPDAVAPLQQGGRALTLARTQRLPGEQLAQQHQQQMLLHAPPTPSAEQARPRPHSSGLLKKARELHEQQQQQRVAGAAGSKPPPQNNIVSTAGLGASAKKGSGAAV